MSMLTSQMKLKNGRMKTPKYASVTVDFERGEWGVEVGHLDKKGFPKSDYWIPAKNRKDAMKKLKEVL